jgi:outer membrane lipoprotein LolB
MSLGVLGSLGVLAGCASLGDVSGGGAVSQPLWAGRLSLVLQTEPVQQWFAGFELSGSPQAGVLLILSPLGQVLGRLHWAPGVATQEVAGQTRHFASLDELTRAATGTELPLTGLFAWLAGQAAPADGWEVDLSQHAQGRIRALRASPLPRAELRVLLNRP